MTGKLAILSRLFIILAFDMACSTVSLALASDHSARAVSTPSPGLRLTASLEHAPLQLGHVVELKIELENVGMSRVLIPAAGRCNPALQVAIWSLSGGLIWAQGLPLCLEPGSTPPIALAPGGAMSATQCFALAFDTSHTAVHCALLDLPPGTYRVGGNFHGMSLPRLGLTLAP